jgi:hypothetical protein
MMAIDIRDRLFSAALSGRFMETVVASASGALAMARLVDLPCACVPAVELQWRCRMLCSGIGEGDPWRSWSESLPDALLRAAAHGEPSPAELELLNAARAWDTAMRTALASLLADPDPEHVAVTRRLSVKPFQPGWEHDPLHALRLFLLKASAQTPKDDDSTDDLGAFLGSGFEARHPEARPLNGRDLDEIVRFAREGGPGGTGA